MSGQITVYISIGNSDDKLSQVEWSSYIADVDHHLRRQVDAMHGNWRSRADDPWQNACWCVEIVPSKAEYIKYLLSETAATYRQDSIAWAVADTEFVPGVVTS